MLKLEVPESPGAPVAVPVAAEALAAV